MSELLGFSLIGMLLIVLLLILLFRSSGFPAEISRVNGASVSTPQAFDNVDKQLSERIFGCEDADFVRSRTSEAAQRLFFKERRRLAHAWLARAQAEAQSVMRIHRLAASKMERLRPTLEVTLACRYFVLQMACRILNGLVFLIGPTAVRRLIVSFTDLLRTFRDLSDTTVTSQRVSEQSR